MAGRTFRFAAVAGSIGRLTTVARYGRDAIAARARAGQWNAYADRIDPDRKLPASELAQRVEDLRRADRSGWRSKARRLG